MNHGFLVASLFLSAIASRADVVFSVTMKNAVHWESNGHHYELVRKFISWTDAKAESEALTLNGMPGHLATVTTQAENDFISGAFGQGAAGGFVWLGGREPLDDGRWIWDSGPETGRQFSQGRFATAPDSYVNWGRIEPNDFQAEEDYLMMNLGELFAGISTGQWADAIRVPNANDPVIGYIVEYEPEVGPELHIEKVGESVSISFASQNGRRYQLQRATALPAAGWTNVGDPVVGTGATLAINDSIAAAENRFYRVEVLR